MTNETGGGNQVYSGAISDESYEDETDNEQAIRIAEEMGFDETGEGQDDDT